jgi:FAD-dependent oxidoreductase domain-containing protein 1
VPHYDVIFIGGGVMACATAYHLLKAEPNLRLVIIEKDPTYEKSSTVLSDGNIRIQFNLKENILMSRYGFEMLSHFSEEMAIGDEKPNIMLRQQGNLFLVDEANREAAQEGMRLQQVLGGKVGEKVEWLDAAQVHERYPFIDPETIAGGTFGAEDGTMDPNAVLQGYKNKAIALGSEYIVGEVVSVNVENNQVQGVTLADGQILASKFVVNSAGAWGTAIAQKLGINLPIEPTMRHIFHFESKLSLDYLMPLTIFPTGLYIHHENGNHFLAGKSLPVDKIGFDFTFKRQLFLEYLWEELAHFIPEFEHLKLLDGWTGLYAVNSFDGNAILGEWSEIKGFILANGFSGHGFQQCHAVGAYLRDIILGRKSELDLSILSPERILAGNPVHENAHKIV